jgi:DNA-binding NarL/FixJ family response regulator
MTLEAPEMDSAVNDENELIRIMLVEEREAMREGLRMMLSGDENIRVVGAARDCNEALARVKKQAPDIVLLDITSLGTNGIKAATGLKEAHPHVSLIFLSDNRKYLVPAIKAGAAGFLTRNIGRTDLTAAIRLIHLWRLVLFDDGGGHFALVKL